MREPQVGPYEARGGANDGATVADLLAPSGVKHPDDCDHAIRAQVAHVTAPDGGTLTVLRCADCGAETTWARRA